MGYYNHYDCRFCHRGFHCAGTRTEHERVCPDRPEEVRVDFDQTWPTFSLLICHRCQGPLHRCAICLALDTWYLHCPHCGPHPPHAG